MGEIKVRRLPVWTANKRLVGIVSLGDLALVPHGPANAGEALWGISEPGGGAFAIRVMELALYINRTTNLDRGARQSDKQKIAIAGARRVQTEKTPCRIVDP